MTGTREYPDDPWLVRIGGDAEPRLRLFCLHHAGASASLFRSWAEALPAGVELTAIQLPGREFRLGDPLLTDMKEIASSIADAVSPLLDRPYAVFGNSMGILIGYNVVTELRARGFPLPRLMIASGRNAPQFKWVDRGMEKLPDAEFIDAVREYNGTPEALLRDPDLQELWLPRLRADLTITAQYEYVDRAPLACPIVVLSAENDHLVSAEGLDGWRDQTTEETRFFRFPGDHFFLQVHHERVLGVVNAELGHLLEKTGGHNEHGARRPTDSAHAD
ncbi:MAG: alpha/beta fold hydrolase [Alphaproteobacteria bacterium]|nr:alpha/beta fold hydrolase [Alphaproteobacteria bacterium]